jgi:hypothetical protein
MALFVGFTTERNDEQDGGAARLLQMIEQNKFHWYFLEVSNGIVHLLTQRYRIRVRPAVDQWTNTVKFIVTGRPEEHSRFLLLQSRE